ncbi:MAG: hypothetical protein WKG01_12925 [Kofleriaceae bacterium]
MRTTLLLAALTLSLLPTTEADACGDYGGDPAPQVMPISTHSGRSEPTEEFRTRSFAVLGPTDGARLRWSMLAVRSYDGTRVAPVSGAMSPRELTLVGASGSRRVTATQRVALDRHATFQAPHLALELDDARDMTFAVAGSRPVSLITLESSSNGIPGTSARTSLVIVDHTPVTEVYLGATSLGRYAGYAVGAITWDGMRFVLVEHEGAITPVRI